MQSHHKYESRLEGKDKILVVTDWTCTIIAVTQTIVVYKYKNNLVQSLLAYVTASTAVPKIILFSKR
jgi:hypothetical protein